MKAKCDIHFVQRRNVIFERARFNRRRQKEGKSVDSRSTHSQSTAYMANSTMRWCETTSSWESETEHSPRNCSEMPTTPCKAPLLKYTQAEAVKKQQPLVRGTPATTTVGAVRGVGRRWNKGYRNDAATPNRKQGCSRCGGSHVHDRAHCPAKDQIFSNCGKRGHFRAVCRSAAKVRGVNTSSEPEKDPENSKDTLLGTVGANSSRDDTWTVTLTLQGKPVTLQFNIGVEVTVIPEKIWREVGQPQLTASDRTLCGPDSRAISTLGMFLGTFTHNNRSMETEVYVVKRLAKPLLGRPIILTLGLVKLVAAVEQQHIALISLPGPRGEYSIEL